MTILSQFTFDDQTNGAVVDPSAHEGWSTAGGSQDMIARSQSARHGGLGARVYQMTAYRTLSYTFPSPTSQTRVLDAYIRFPSVPTTHQYFMSLRNDAGTVVADVRASANGTVAIRNGTLATAISTDTIESGRWYRFAWQVSTSGQELRVFDGDASSPLFTLSGALDATTFSLFSVGAVTNATGNSIELDSIRVATTFEAPVNPAVPLPTPTGFSLVASSSSLVLTASWNVVTGANSYEVEVERQEAGLWVPLSTHRTVNPTLSLTSTHGLVQDTLYRARVRAYPSGI